jgi:hypothetical protein
VKNDTARTQASARNERLRLTACDPGGIYLYPESETNFFMQIYDNAQLTFLKNEHGQVTSMIHRVAGGPEKVLKKLPDRIL